MRKGRASLLAYYYWKVLQHPGWIVIHMIWFVVFPPHLYWQQHQHKAGYGCKLQFHSVCSLFLFNACTMWYMEPMVTSPVSRGVLCVALHTGWHVMSYRNDSLPTAAAFDTALTLFLWQWNMKLYCIDWEQSSLYIVVLNKTVWRWLKKKSGLCMWCCSILICPMLVPHPLFILGIHLLRLALSQYN